MTSAQSAPLTVDQALAHIVGGVEPLPAEHVPITAARGRILAEPLAAKFTQPPFDASAMDGYAVRCVDIGRLPATLTLIGESGAGHPFAGRVGPHQAVRIFTGAPVPEGADGIVIQENVAREGDAVIVREGGVEKDHIRRRGGDFAEGTILLEAGRSLGPRELSLAAAMGHGALPVRRRPRVAVLATGDELVEPGRTPQAGQITASNHLGVAAMAERAGADVTLLGIAQDTRESLAAHVAAASAHDVLVTIGGASVGDYDLVAPVLGASGMQLAFWKIAMRPGKPLMFGALRSQRVLGLPGNPVSALVCARLFLLPLIDALLGRPQAAHPLTQATTTHPIEANGPRAHYMRGRASIGRDGARLVTPMPSQDSSLLTSLAAADILIVRPIRAPAVEAGGFVDTMPLDF